MFRWKSLGRGREVLEWEEVCRYFQATAGMEGCVYVSRDVSE